MMRFAKTVFNIAGIYGLIVLLPHFFMETTIGEGAPPPITHPEFFYGFVGVGVAWQLAFLIIAREPLRYRMIMLPSIAEKWLFVASGVGLMLMGRTAMTFAIPVSIDFILGAFFLMAFIKTGKEKSAITA